MPSVTKRTLAYFSTVFFQPLGEVKKQDVFVHVRCAESCLNYLVQGQPAFNGDETLYVFQPLIILTLA